MSCEDFTHCAYFRISDDKSFPQVDDKELITDIYIFILGFVCQAKWAQLKKFKNESTDITEVDSIHLDVVFSLCPEVQNKLSGMC